MASLRDIWDQVCEIERRSSERNRRLLKELEDLENNVTIMSIKTEQMRLARENYLQMYSYGRSQPSSFDDQPSRTSHRLIRHKHLYRNVVPFASTPHGSRFGGRVIERLSEFDSPNAVSRQSNRQRMTVSSSTQTLDDDEDNAQLITEMDSNSGVDNEEKEDRCNRQERRVSFSAIPSRPSPHIIESNVIAGLPIVSDRPPSGASQRSTKVPIARNHRRFSSFNSNTFSYEEPYPKPDFFVRDSASVKIPNRTFSDDSSTFYDASDARKMIKDNSWELPPQTANTDLVAIAFIPPNIDLNQNRDTQEDSVAIIDNRVSEDEQFVVAQSKVLSELSDSSEQASLSGHDTFIAEIEGGNTLNDKIVELSLSKQMDLEVDFKVQAQSTARQTPSDSPKRSSSPVDELTKTPYLMQTIENSTSGGNNDEDDDEDDDIEMQIAAVIQKPVVLNLKTVENREAEGIIAQDVNVKSDQNLTKKIVERLVLFSENPSGNPNQVDAKVVRGGDDEDDDDFDFYD